MDRLRQTPSQTVGPFFAYSLTAEQYGYAYNSLMNHALVSDETPDDYADAERILVTGRVFDGRATAFPTPSLNFGRPVRGGSTRPT